MHLRQNSILFSSSPSPPSPPISPNPVLHGSVTARAAAIATAASAALPPCRRMRNPASLANGCDDATIPLVAINGERRDGGKNGSSGEWGVYD